MESYSEKVKEVFESQGFEVELKVTESGEKYLSAVKDGDEKLAVAYLQKGSFEERRKKLEEFSKIETLGRKIFFTGREEKGEKLEKLGKEKDVEVSFFTPFEKEESMERPENMPSSYEVIGNIAVLNLEPHQKKNKEEIADYLMEQNPNVETVLNKVKELSGEFRVGGYEVVKGDGTETVHVEHGTRLKLDPTKTFFSERLGHERQRVVEQVAEGETVQAWFAGVGPYPIITARKRNPGKVYAIEKNPDACEYLKENIEMNKVGGKVEAFCGDVRKIAPKLDKADRIIMPLPKGSKTFLDLAFDCIKEGGIIHYYRFAGEDERWEKIENEIREVAEAKGRKFDVCERVLCGHYAPYVHRVCVDFKVF